MSCEYEITNTILYTVHSRSWDKLRISRHHSMFNISTIPIVPIKFEGLFHKCTVHSSATVHILSLLSISWRRLQILLIVVWVKLWTFVIRGPPSLPILGMILKKVFIVSCLWGFFLSLLSISLPLHYSSLVLEELVSVVLLIENALTGSCNCQKMIRTSLLESYENATSWCRH